MLLDMQKWCKNILEKDRNPINTSNLDKWAE